MLKVFEFDITKSEYRADSSFPTLWPRVIFSFPKMRREFLGHSKYVGREQGGNTGLQSQFFQEEKFKDISVVTGMEEIKAFNPPTQRDYCIPQQQLPSYTC